VKKSPRKKVLLSWSSGKDSAWALHILQESNEVELIGLITTFNEQFNRVAMHAVRQELVRQQAAAAELELFEVYIPWPCSNDDYEKAMSAAFINARDEYGVRHIAFGDLYLEDIRAYRERLLVSLDLEPLFPIWGIPTDKLAKDMIDSGLKAKITCLDPKKLSKDFAGRTFDKEFLDDLPECIDPCGEEGEFHTFTYSGPMFKNDIAVETGEVVTRDGFIFADLLPV